MLSRGSSGHVARHRDKGRGEEMSDETSPRWPEREVREVSRRVLSVLRRALEAGTLEPEREEPGDHVMRGQGASGEESVGECTRGGPCPPKGRRRPTKEPKVLMVLGEGAAARRGRGVTSWEPRPRKDRSQSLPRRADRVLRGNSRREQVQVRETEPPRSPQTPGQGVRASLLTRGEARTSAQERRRGEARPQDMDTPEAAPCVWRDGGGKL